MDRPFVLERHFAQYEHALGVMLSSSDCEPITARELLGMAGRSPDELLDLTLSYTEARGAERLRRAVSRWYPGTSADDVLVVNAPQEAVYWAMHALVRPGDRVVVQTPCYQSLRDVPRERGAEVIEWPVVPSGDSFAIDFDRLEALLTEPTALLVTNFPHNPTGVCPTQDEWIALAFLVERSGVRWFNDEMYRGLARDDQRELPSAATEIAGAMSLWGLSKSLNLPGLRLGWLVCRDRPVLAEIERMKDWTSICSNALSERCAEVALEVGPALFTANRARIAENEAALGRFLADRPGAVTWTAPTAGPVSLARVHGMTATELATRARDRASALLVPSSLFDLPDTHVRFGLGRAHFDRWLASLDRALAG
jgi:aspartate/methionine/tyrosine aminotransferase